MLFNYHEAVTLILTTMTNHQENLNGFPVGQSKNLENTSVFIPKTQHRVPIFLSYVIISGHVINFKLILYIFKKVMF